jgi:hypothetical protein
LALREVLPVSTIRHILDSIPGKEDVHREINMLNEAKSVPPVLNAPDKLLVRCASSWEGLPLGRLEKVLTESLHGSGRPLETIQLAQVAWKVVPSLSLLKDQALLIYKLQKLYDWLEVGISFDASGGNSRDARRAAF